MVIKSQPGVNLQKGANALCFLRRLEALFCQVTTQQTLKKPMCIWEARATGFHTTSHDGEIQVQYSVQELVRFSRMTNLLLEDVSPTTLGILHMKCYS